MEQSKTPDQESHDINDENLSSVAIIGMSGRFPGAPDLNTFWKNLINGVESIRFFTEKELLEAGLPEALINDKDFVPARAAIDDHDKFDANFFGISPREATLLDPQHRLFLECAWSSLEDAGYDPKRYDGKIGVFGGCSSNTYFLNNLLSDRSLFDRIGGIQALLASDKDYLATRVSYKLDLKGPSVVVLSACSTSLVTVHYAYQSLLNYECDIALAGGVSVNVPNVGGHRHQQGAIYSPDGHCRTFDEKAAGTVVGDGVGIVTLKRLEDAIEDQDHIYAVLLGSAVNNDGSQKVGYTAPNVTAQTEVISAAQEFAGVDVESITYIEAHGTGTHLGDPIEIAALSEAFRQHTQKKSYCAISSVKTNVGHLNAAAGIAGLIKATLSLKNKQLAPNLHFEKPNPEIDFPNSPFYVNTKASEWHSDGPRRAGVSSFGAGGTNAHIILEESPNRIQTKSSKQLHFLPLSAKTANALDQQTKQLKSYLEKHPETPLADIAFTLQQGRQEFTHRRLIITENKESCLKSLSSPEKETITNKVPKEGTKQFVYLFPPQGTQKLRMGEQLYQHSPAFRKAFNQCAKQLQKLARFDLKGLLYPKKGSDEETQAKLDNQQYAGPALFSISYAMAKMWQAQGYQADVVLGHSTGEYAAACIAGIFSYQDALRLLVERAKLIETQSSGGGLHVFLTPQEVEDILIPDTYLALQNGPRACVVTGTTEAIKLLQAKLNEAEIPTRTIRISGPAHCPLFQPISQDFSKFVKKISLKKPTIPFLSAITGTWLSDEQALDPNYWAQHLVKPVKFVDAMNTLRSKKGLCFLELGPQRSMSSLTALNMPEAPIIPSVLKSQRFKQKIQPKEFEAIQQASFWSIGLDAPWQKDPERFAAKGQRISLPTYPFEKTKYWIDAKPGVIPVLANLGTEGLALSKTVAQAPTKSNEQSDLAKQLLANLHPRPDLETSYLAPRSAAENLLVEICQEILGIGPIGVRDDFLALGADSLITLRILDQLEKLHGMKLPPAAAFGGLNIERLAKFIDKGKAAQISNNADKASTKHSEQVEAPYIQSNSLDEVLIPLQTGGKKPPLYLAHPASGVVFPYFELTKLLPSDQPVYGLQALGLDGKTEPDLSCEQMGTRYLEAIKKFQPEGPYYLGGYSFGCYVSYELSIQLEAQGDDIALLALMDEVVPLDGMRPQWSDLMRLLVGRSGKSAIKHMIDYIYLLNEISDKGKQIQSTREKWSKRLRQSLTRKGVRNLLQHTAMAGLLPQETHWLALDQPAMKPMFELFALHSRITFEYSPPPYSGSAHLFKSEWSEQAAYKKRYPDPTLGWKNLILGGVQIHRCSGDHLGMLRLPYVKTLAKELEQVLYQIQQEYD